MSNSDEKFFNTWSDNDISNTSDTNSISSEDLKDFENEILYDNEIFEQKLKDEITQKLLDSKLLVDPIVTIRLLNYRVTVLGEVAHPTVVTVPNERISILEALGLAGDITIYGKKENVLLIREEKGSKVIKRINLNSSEIFSSPYYYLKSNDVIYVEPNQAKVASASQGRQLVPTLLAALSLVAIILTRVIQ